MKKKIPVIIIFLAIISSSLYFGLPRLHSFTGVDEPLWSYDRIPSFWPNVLKGNWVKTDLCDKPGITLAAISGLGLPFSKNPLELKHLYFQPKSPEQLQNIADLYYNLRLPVYLFSLLMLPIYYFFIKRLFGPRVALISILFMGLSPVLLGISLIINTDALLWIFMPLIILSFLIYQKEKNRKFLYLTGFLFGLGMITKFVTSLLFPFLFLLIFAKYIFDGSSEEKANGYFKKAFLDYAILIAIAVVTIVALFPAIWVKPHKLLDVLIFNLAFESSWSKFFPVVLIVAAEIYLNKARVTGTVCDFFRKYKSYIISAIFIACLVFLGFAAINVYSGMKFFDFQPAFTDPTIAWSNTIAVWGAFNATLLSSFYPLLFGLTPIVAILFIISLIFSLFRIDRKESAVLVSYLASFILIYYIGSAFSGVPPTVRYQIVVFPVASIMAAYGLITLLDLDVKKNISRRVFYPIVAVIFLCSIFSLREIRPYYLSYASSLLPDKYVLNFKDMGDGSWQIAQYLNKLPNAGSLKIWSDKGAVCEAFAGSCDDSLKKGHIEGVNFDYLVTTAGREAKSKAFEALWASEFNGNLTIDKLYSPDLPYIYRINIDNRPQNFLKVLKPSDIYD